MEPIKTNPRDNKSPTPTTMPDFNKGLYHSNTVNKEPEIVFNFVKDQANLKKILSDLPEGVENFLELEKVNSLTAANGQFKVEYKNNESAKMQGNLKIEIGSGPAGKGATLTAFADFGDYSFKDEGPSDLINIFLKRIKAMVETGMIATTKGQPNGNEEVVLTELKH